MIVTDPAAEKGVISGIIRYGSTAYFDSSTVGIKEESFSEDTNAILYKILCHIFKKEENENLSKVDIPTIYSAANEINQDHIFKRDSEIAYLKALMGYPIDRGSIKKFAVKLRKLDIARHYDRCLAVARQELSQITGSEKLADILGIGEKAIFEFNNSLLDKTDEPHQLGDGIDALLDQFENNPKDQVGISTGWPKFDCAIGGGLRPGTVNVIGARTGIGKTTITCGMGFHISHNIGVPVLIIDTEMQQEDHQVKLLAKLSGVKIQDLETGKYARDPRLKKKVREAAALLKNTNYQHKMVGGMGIEEIVSIIKRWIVKDVGVDVNGFAKPCVIFYDYLKLMDQSDISSNMAEYQAMGFLLTKLHDMAARYRLPIVAFLQLNRDGITKEDASAASQSDRIIWLCSNFSIYKQKSDEEIASDGPENGTRKLITVKVRHGGGLKPGEYINMVFDGAYAKIEEGLTNYEIKDGKTVVKPKKHDKSNALSEQTGDDEQDLNSRAT